MGCTSMKRIEATTVADTRMDALDITEESNRTEPWAFLSPCTSSPHSRQECARPHTHRTDHYLLSLCSRTPLQCDQKSRHNNQHHSLCCGILFRHLLTQ